jgi:hypothetical protein
MLLANRLETLQSLTELTAKLPPNLAGSFSDEQLRTIFNAVFNDMVWPQVTNRLPFEQKWNRLQKMYEVKRNEDRPRSRQKPEVTTPNQKKDAPIQLADTIIFDTVDRLKNLNYFICWKDQPVQYNRPRYTYTPLEDEFYSPTSRKIRSANAILNWNLELQQVRQKHLKLAQHHYLYGLSFAMSDFVFEIDTDQSSDEFLLVTNIGTTFEPISIRKLWLNPLLPIDQMEKQACPFYFDLFTRDKILANQYNPQTNPFGFLNLEKLNTPQYLYGPEAVSFIAGLPEATRSTTTQFRPEFSGEALWTFFPVLQLPGEQQAKRYIIQCFANNLFSGGIIPLRIQELYYPRKRLPIYGASHIPDLDSGLYTPSIAEILESHYDELVRSKEQIILNKDWINNPPTEVMSGSPASVVSDINAPGAKYEVHGANDVTRRAPYDATQTTLVFMQQTRESAQTSGKAVDAILGKAMGGRTTATEASNAFQASMSGVTADVDHFSLSFYGQYALRVWENTGKFVPKGIRDRICGNADAPPISDQDYAIQIGIKTDVGSTFIESIAKQQHLQQAIASSTASPFLDQAVLWKALFRELKLTEAMDAVKDNGFEFEVARATEQACETYRGQVIAIDPSQDHQIALRVKTRFLQDSKSIYNTEMAGNPAPVPGLTVAQYLAQQIQIHQQFVMIQMQQQMAMQMAIAQDEGNQQQQKNELKQGKLAGKSEPAKLSNTK